VQDSSDLIDSWIEAFDMHLNPDGVWEWRASFAEGHEWFGKYAALAKQWNQIVPEYNAVVAPRRRNVGRPLAASAAQRQTVLKLRKAGQSLRAIAEETSLGLNTVRTIVDQRDQRDRTAIKHMERIRRDMGEERTWLSRKRTRDGLPRRINALQQESTELQKEAKGLK
jgi:Helix-turn-helix domain of resolvase